jgi:hypothetical protein
MPLFLRLDADLDFLRNLASHAALERQGVAEVAIVALSRARASVKRLRFTRGRGMPIGK